MPIVFKPFLNKASSYKGGKAKSNSDTEIYKLSSNENQFGTSNLAKEAVQEYANQLNEYPDSTDLRLRQALAAFNEEGLEANQFFTCNGAVRGIDMIMRGFLEENSEVVFSDPGFTPYKDFPDKYGAVSIDIPLIGEHFDLDVTSILNTCNLKTKILFIGSPNNPTGSCPKKADLDTLFENLPDHIVTVYDEVYHQFAEQQDYVRAHHYLKMGKPIIGLNSFSKAYGLAGLRIGYGYSTTEIASYLRNIPTPFPINVLSTEAAIAALQDSDFINQTVQGINEGKLYLYEELVELGIKFWQSQANFILMKPPMDIFEFEEKMLGHGIMVRPAKNFGFDGIRLTIGRPEQNRKVIEALRSILA